MLRSTFRNRDLGIASSFRSHRFVASHQGRREATAKDFVDTPIGGEYDVVVVGAGKLRRQ